jgi:hypothetical protein
VIGPATVLIRERRALETATAQLIRELKDSVPAGMVMATVARCRGELIRAGVRDGLARRAEAMARKRLSAGTPADPEARTEPQSRAEASPPRRQ